MAEFSYKAIGRDGKSLDGTIEADGLELASRHSEQANVAKSTFLANMSFELRTPLNAIVGFTELIKKHTLDDQGKKYLASITSALDTLCETVNRLMDLSKIE